MWPFLHPETVSQNSRPERDAVSAYGPVGKLHPAPGSNCGPSFPPEPSTGNCVPLQRQILGRTFRNPIHPESPSHSECIKRTHESVSSRTSRLSHLYCFARRTANGEATLPARPSWRLQSCYPDLPWWDGPSRQPSCRAASYSARCRDLARAWPRSAA